ncbi:hypothetical protein ABID62_009175 [Bradyrhizobium sp. S3.9.1]
MPKGRGRKKQQCALAAAARILEQYTTYSRRGFFTQGSRLDCGLCHPRAIDGYWSPLRTPRVSTIRACWIALAIVSSAALIWHSPNAHTRRARCVHQSTARSRMRRDEGQARAGREARQRDPEHADALRLWHHIRQPESGGELPSTPRKQERFTDEARREPALRRSGSRRVAMSPVWSAAAHVGRTAGST